MSTKVAGADAGDVVTYTHGSPTVTVHSDEAVTRASERDPAAGTNSETGR